MFGTPHTITVTLKADGTMETVVDGIKGPSCEEATRFLEELGTVTADSNTPEFYQSDLQGVGLAAKF